MPSKEKAPFILFVNPSLGTKTFAREDRFRSYLSLGTLASALRDKPFLKKFAFQSGRMGILLENEEDYPSFRIKVANVSLKPGEHTIHQFLETVIKEAGIQPELVCATATSAQLAEAREVAEASRRIAPGALRVIGGAHVSVLGEEFLRSSEFQVACLGEGVETLTELALSVHLSGNASTAGVSGIAFKDPGGKVRVNPPRQFLFDLDQYPFPSDSLGLFADDLDDTGKNGRDLVYLLAGSGCPYRCAFCAQHAIHRGRVRERSPDNIFGEMRKLYGLGFRKFALVQETFLTHRARVERFCELIEKSGLPLEWTVEARADQVHYDLLERMEKAGLKFIQIGLESADPDLLNRVGKGIALDQVKKVRDWCEQLSINTAFYLLVGLPGQDWQSILKSALFVREHPPYNRVTMHLSVAVAVPYPGTRIAEEGSVRLVGKGQDPQNWPDRRCTAEVNEEGAFVGNNFTETDDMVSEEIMEAYTYLDDFGHFLLHAQYDPAYSDEERRKARDFAARAFYMIERRTVRDLVARAREDLSPEKYRRARAELLARDGSQESSFREVTACRETWEILSKFLAGVNFTNGFQTMKCLPPASRVKWMKLCALVWHRSGSRADRIRFDQDSEKAGEDLKMRLDGVPEEILDEMLERVAGDRDGEGLLPEWTLQGKVITAMGFSFGAGSEGMIRVMDS